MRILEKLKLNFSFFKKQKMNKDKKIVIIFIIIFLWTFNIYNLYINYSLNQTIERYEYKSNKIIIDRNYFNENIILKDYSDSRYKIKQEWKAIINNIRNLHKSPVLISHEFQDKELCAGFIWELSQKIWWKKSIYNIWMQNLKKRKLAQAWELPYFYEAFGWKVLSDLWEKFSLEEENYVEKITISDLKEFFAKAFSEEALFWDIWFLYSKTKYTDFLKKWSSNSHITKNMWVSEFEITLSNIDENKTDLENIMNNLGCSNNFIKYIDILENYKISLNNKNILFYNKKFYYLNSDNSLWGKVIFKYLDKITYKDITIVHFFEWKSHVDSLLQYSCDLEFYPINVMSINGRMIEKM